MHAHAVCIAIRSPEALQGIPVSKRIANQLAALPLSRSYEPLLFRCESVEDRVVDAPLNRELTFALGIRHFRKD